MDGKFLRRAVMEAMSDAPTSQLIHVRQRSKVEVVKAAFMPQKFFTCCTAYL